MCTSPSRTYCKWLRVIYSHLSTPSWAQRAYLLANSQKIWESQKLEQCPRTFLVPSGPRTSSLWATNSLISVGMETARLNRTEVPATRAARIGPIVCGGYVSHDEDPWFRHLTAVLQVTLFDLGGHHGHHLLRPEEWAAIWLAMAIQFEGYLSSGRRTVSR